MPAWLLFGVLTIGRFQAGWLIFGFLPAKEGDTYFENPPQFQSIRRKLAGDSEAEARRALQAAGDRRGGAMAGAGLKAFAN